MSFAQLLRDSSGQMLAAADAGDLSGGHHDEHAAQFGKPGDDGASRQAGLYLRAPIGLTVETEAFGDPAFDTIIVGAITAFEMAHRAQT
jgi:hypothetical protein